MKKSRSCCKLIDNEWETERFAYKYSFQKGQKYADLGRSSVTKALPNSGIGNDRVMFGNWIIFTRVAVAAVGSFLHKWGTLWNW